MGLLSFLKSKFSSSAAAAPARGDASDIVAEARARARRRLIGATVLLGAGIVAFPLLFESQPRPIPVDLPIEIPAREGIAPLQQPVSKVDARRPETLPAEPIDEPTASPGEKSTASAPGVVKDVAQLAGAAVVAKTAAAVLTKPGADKPEPKPAASKPAVSKPEVKPEPKPAAKPEPKPATKPEPKPAAKPEPKQEAKPDAAKAAVTKPAAEDGRFVVQIGAFAEVGSAREARMKVEGMGLKTYTQVIESSTGRRIRVRVGPYSTKADADKAAARIKSGGLPAAVLVL